MDKKHQKCPKKGGFPPFATPHDLFFKNRALSLLCPYGALTLCKKIEKTNEQSLRYLKTDTQTGGQGLLLRTPSGKPGVENELKVTLNFF